MDDPAARQDRSDLPQTVTRRRVFYVPGFDPFPARRYRELYRTEAASQAAVSGHAIAVSASPDDPSRWRVAARTAGAAHEVRTEVTVLGWSDIVQATMGQSIPATYAQLVRTAWLYLSTGTLRRLSWIRKGPILAALYPFAVLILQALLAWLVLALVSGVVERVLRAILGLVLDPVAGWPARIAWALALAPGLWAGWRLLAWFKARDHRLYAWYLLHDYAFTASRRGAYPPVLEDRLDAFRARLRAALASDVDEVLLVGHSSGAHLAVSLAADLFRLSEVPVDGPAFGLLTLGQSIPMVSFLPEAQRLRRDLHALASEPRIAWIDVSAPGDGCAFALADPVAVTGLDPVPKLWPLVLSAAFSQTLGEQTRRRLRRRWFRLHFQYLCAFDRPGDYDYFAITAGPVTLADRFRGRAPSPARIDVRASRYTSRAP